MGARVLAYAPRRRVALSAPLKRLRVPYRIAESPAELEREMKAFKPSIVLADAMSASSPELLGQVRGRAIFVGFSFSNESQVKELLKLLRESLDARGVRLERAVPDASGGSPLSLEDLHDPDTGRLDGRRIAGWLGVSLTRFAKFIGRSVQSVHKAPASVALQPRLGVFARIAVSLTTLFGTRERARMWLNAPNPDLDGAVPMAFLAKRKAEVVADLLEDALLGHPG